MSQLEPIRQDTLDPEGSEISFTAAANFFGAENILNFGTNLIGSVVDFVVGTDESGDFDILPRDASYQFEIKGNQTADVNVHFATSAIVGGINNEVVVLKNIEGTNSWEAIAQQSASGVAVLGIGAAEGNLNLNDLEPGKYTVAMSVGTSVAIGSTSSADVSIDYSNYLMDANGEYAQTEAASGNVLTDGETPDVRGNDTELLIMDEEGEFTLVSESVSVEGEYGTLTINPDGSYSYEPNPGVEGSVGQSDVFEYQLRDPASGVTDTATLTVQIEEGQITAETEVDASFNALVSPVEPSSTEVVNGDGDDINFLTLANAGGIERLFNTASSTIGKVIDLVVGDDEFGEFQVLPTNRSYQFTVEEGHTSDIRVEYGSDAVLGVQSNVALTLFKQVGENQWAIVTNGTASGVFDVLGFGGPSAVLEQNDIGPGTYMLGLSLESGVGAGTTVWADAEITDHTYAVDADGNFANTSPAAGNIFDDIPGIDPATAELSIVIDGTSAIVDEGSIVLGDAGELSINPDGSYVYSPAPSADSIGMSDLFEYTYETGDGEVHSGTLAINVLNGDVYTQVQPDVEAAQLGDDSNDTIALDEALAGGPDEGTGTADQSDNSDSELLTQEAETIDLGGSSGEAEGDSSGAAGNTAEEEPALAESAPTSDPMLDLPSLDLNDEQPI